MVRMLTETPAAGAARLCAYLGLTLLSACGTTYLMQAGSGELHVLQAREPIAAVVADPQTTPQLRARLSGVHAARVFATSDLHLPDNASYTTYADIHRQYVVWNVVAAPEFSVEPLRWCFPFSGCVAYRGYFHEHGARDFALGLETQGYDVLVEGVPAYSTLGHFADPVLSSMLQYDDDQLAATIFHELAHQLIYVAGDSEFNEAFATTVEDAGLERWLVHQGNPERIRAYRESQAHAQQFLVLLSATRARLARLYASGAPVGELRIGKVRILGELAAELRTLEARQQARYPLYEEWLAVGLNNAQLAAVATYYECVPGFRRLLHDSGDELERFYAAVRAVAQLPRAERHARLCAAAPVGAAAG
jgi:predicted aminopeptidase